jgi:hypothetical protein
VIPSVSRWVASLEWRVCAHVHGHKSKENCAHVQVQVIAAGGSTFERGDEDDAQEEGRCILVVKRTMFHRVSRVENEPLWGEAIVAIVRRLRLWCHLHKVP